MGLGYLGNERKEPGVSPILRPSLETEDEKPIHLEEDNQRVLASEENVHVRDHFEPEIKRSRA